MELSSYMNYVMLNNNEGFPYGCSQIKITQIYADESSCNEKQLHMRV